MGFFDTRAVREQLEFLLRVLLSVDMAERDESQRRFHLFCGNLILQTFYMCWLGTVGLLQRGSTDDLSPDGRSALMMLMASESAARMPLRRVTWSLAFDDQIVRDDLFAWIAARVDQWDHWGRMAYRRGGNAFTQDVLGLLVASKSPQT